MKEIIKDPMKLTEMKPTICEMKNTLYRTNGRLDITKKKKGLLN